MSKLPRLSDAQIEVLTLLEDGPRTTSLTTTYGYVSGVCAEALVRRGLAKRVSKLAFRADGTPYFESGPNQVEITQQGREVIEARRKERAR